MKSINSFEYTAAAAAATAAAAFLKLSEVIYFFAFSQAARSLLFSSVALAMTPAFAALYLSVHELFGAFSVPSFFLKKLDPQPELFGGSVDDSAIYSDSE